MCEVEQIFAPLGRVRLVDGRSLDSADIGSADIVLVRSVTPLNQATLGTASPRFIGSATSGVDHVDRDELARRGIPFAWAPGSNAESVIQYVCCVLALQPGLLQRLLAGARVGIIGYGVIGSALCERLGVLGIECCAYDPWLESGHRPELASLDEVLACDVVTLHAELTHRQPYPSYHLLQADELSCLRPGTLLINAGRGELIDNRALLALLQQRDDVTVVLDVWEGEPQLDRELLAHCWLGTAHIAGYSYDGKLRATRMLYYSACQALGTDPQPMPPAAEGEGGILTVPAWVAAASPAEFLSWLFILAYDVRADHRALCEGLDEPGFDGLRRDYPLRRELSAFRLQSAVALSDWQQTVLRAFSVQGEN